MRTYLISYDKHDGDSGCVELPGMVKLILWIMRNARHLCYFRVSIGNDGQYDYGALYPKSGKWRWQP